MAPVTRGTYLVQDLLIPGEFLHDRPAWIRFCKDHRVMFWEELETMSAFFQHELHPIRFYIAAPSVSAVLTPGASLCPNPAVTGK